MLPVRFEIIAITYCSTIFETHVFCLHSHLCIYIATHLWYGISQLAAGSPWVQFMEHLKITIEWNQGCTPRSWSSECGNALGGHKRANLKAVIEQVGRDTCMPWSSQFEGTLGSHERANFEAVMEQVQRFTSMPWSSEFGDMHLELMIMWTWRL